MEHKNDNQIRDYDKVLDGKYGAPGTPEREQFEAEAEAFYSGQLLRNARKEAGMTQAEVATKIGANKSYISRIENGLIVPTATSFFRIIAAMGMQVQKQSLYLSETVEIEESVKSTLPASIRRA